MSTGTGFMLKIHHPLITVRFIYHAVLQTGGVHFPFNSTFVAAFAVSYESSTCHACTSIFFWLGLLSCSKNTMIHFFIFPERFVIVSYNILADRNVWNHRSELYWHVPPFLLDWDARKRKLVRELGLWSPDIICFQVNLLSYFHEDVI